MTILSLEQIITALAVQYGSFKVEEPTEPLAMILWESVAYLADDERRGRAFALLRDRVGLEPDLILAASDETLLEATRHGIMPEARVGRLREVASIALAEFDGDLSSVLALPMANAKRALMKFPGIGEPGAEKILLYNHAYPVLPLESNGLRVLARLIYGKEEKSYSATYRLVQSAVHDQLPQDCDRLILAHRLLRHHGQQTCRRTEPRCNDCPLQHGCAYAQAIHH